MCYCIVSTTSVNQGKPGKQDCTFAVWEKSGNVIKIPKIRECQGISIFVSLKESNYLYVIVLADWLYGGFTVDVTPGNQQFKLVCLHK